jgi:hypothetical protein
MMQGNKGRITEIRLYSILQEKLKVLRMNSFKK